MKIFDIYQNWITCPSIDKATKKELQTISKMPLEIEDRFYKHLEFGTGGVRGLLGAGRNRINRYTIRRITQGLADYIASYTTVKQKGVVIAYDSRHQSKKLALETALTLNDNGIKPYLFNSICPTPLLSFAVRDLKAIAGVVITASHNPPEYNGYKVYWEDGSQIVPSMANKIEEKIKKIEELPSTSLSNKKDLNGIIFLGKELDDRYISRLKQTSLHPEIILKMSSSFTIVYTPLHGVGNKLIQRVLRETGFTRIYTVPEQEQPNSDFPTVKSPNPEEFESFQLAISYGKSKNTDIILATDPDCDRVGVVIKNAKGEYERLTGNQVGVLLLYYLLSEKTKQKNQLDNEVVIKTIVTSQMGKIIADEFGVETIETHTGFKYIGEQISILEKSRKKEFLFGYEESCGYLAGTFVRDKDGVMATFLICEMAAYYKSLNLNLYDLLQILYQKYGYFLEKLETRKFKGKEGDRQIISIMQKFRRDMPKRIGSHVVTQICDYEQQKLYELSSNTCTKLTLPKENVLTFTLDDGSWFCLRPSGTESKIKVYFSVRDQTYDHAGQKLKTLVHHVMNLIDYSAEVGV